MEKSMRDGDKNQDSQAPQEDVTNGSPSSEGKMVIKLKIPKLAAAMEGERSSEEVIGSSKRVCPECNKEFSSGKALGGHMRVHVQAANRNTFLKPSKKVKKEGEDVNNGDQNSKEDQQQTKPYMSCLNDEGKPTCSICGKNFPSMKSLFGHMRCHPERIWRGIVPPPNTPTAAASRRNKPSSSGSSSSSLSENGLTVTNGDDQAVDLVKLLPKWTVRERRGRKALKTCTADDDQVLREAVEDLMSLAHGGPPSSMAESDVTHKQLQVLEGTNSNSSTIKEVKGEEKEKNTLEIRSTKSVTEEEIEGSDNDSDSGNTNEQLLINFKCNKLKKRKKMKMKLMMELEQEMVAVGDLTPPLALASPESKYKCTTCNKCFTSHQALGGHRSSHNKTKIITSSDHHHHHQIEEDDSGSLVMNQPGEKEVEFGSLHQCKICNKIFPTGQALGGHKRCHWTGSVEAQAQAPSSQVTSTGEAGSHTGSGRKVLDFDLNELPPMTMEDGNGCASSSYNSNMG